MLLWSIIPLFDKLGLGDKKNLPLIGLSLRLCAGFLMILPIIVLSGNVREQIGELSGREIFMFSMSAIISMIISQYFYYRALQENDVARLFPILFGGAPVLTMIWGWLFLKETFTIKTLIGGLLIALGGSLML